MDEIFDAISYSKGASVIRMLHNYIGDVVRFFKHNLVISVTVICASMFKQIELRKSSKMQLVLMFVRKLAIRY